MAEGLGADACARSPSLSGSWASLPRPHPRPRDLPSPWGLATPHPLGGASDPQSAAATAETQAVRIQARPWVSAEAGSAGRGHPCAASSDRKDTRGGVELTTGPGEEAEGPLRGPPSPAPGSSPKGSSEPSRATTRVSGRADGLGGVAEAACPPWAPGFGPAPVGHPLSAELPAAPYVPVVPGSRPGPHTPFAVMPPQAPRGRGSFSDSWFRPPGRFEVTCPDHVCHHRSSPVTFALVTWWRWRGDLGPETTGSRRAPFGAPQGSS